MIKFEIANGQIKGGRDYQDDYFSLVPDVSEEKACLFLLADGMGGYSGGAIASKTIIENFKIYFKKYLQDKQEPKDALNNALLSSNRALERTKKEKPEHKQMGATLIALYLTDKKAYWVSVGDSPLWLIRDGEKIRRVNQNHSIAGLLKLQYENGEITKEEMQNATNKHMLTSAITGEELNLVDLNELKLKDGDIFILASDGIETLQEDRVENIVKSSKNSKEATQEILNAITKAEVPNQDNATLVIIKSEILTQQSQTTTPMNKREATETKDKESITKEQKGLNGSFIIISILLFIAIVAIVALFFTKISLKG